MNTDEALHVEGGGKVVTAKLSPELADELRYAPLANLKGRVSQRFGDSARIISGQCLDYAELERLLNELRIYGDAPGSSFFLIRQAQAFAREKKIPQALRAIAKAIERTPNLLSPYFIRAEILMSLNDISGVEKDLQEIDALLEKSGAISEGDEIETSRDAGEGLDRETAIPTGHD